MKNQPPKFPQRLIEWFVDRGSAEDLIGDMDEFFYQNLQTKSPYKAKWKYWAQCLSLIFSYGLRRRRQQSSHSFSGFGIAQNYTKVAVRSLVKHKFFTIINVLGLSIGMSIGLLALAAFMDMKEVDDFHTHKNNIYRVVSEVKNQDGRRTYASTSLPLADALEQNVHGIDEVVRVSNTFHPNIQSGNTTIPLSGYFADNSFLDVFSFKMLSGDPSSALEKPNSIVLTKSAADKLFRIPNPVGQTLQVEGRGEFIVTGILEDYPRSHFFFESLASFSTIDREGLENVDRTNWGPITDYHTYFKVQDKVDQMSIQNYLASLSGQQFVENSNISVLFQVQHLLDIPKTDYYNEIGMVWGLLAITIFFALALLILLPACFNYANISISRAMIRSKEIGLRKVVGGQRSQIFFQFITESVIIALVSLAGAALLFTQVRSEFLKIIVHGSRAFDLQISPGTGLAFAGFAVATGIIAGAFPAMYFSKLNPIEALRSSFNTHKLGKVSVRKSLIVLQFTISLVFILGVTIIIKQHRYALNYDLGFAKENILDVQLRGIDPEIFAAEFSKIPEVSKISMSSSFPGVYIADGTYTRQPLLEDSVYVYQMFINEHYLDNLELTLLGGQNFNSLHANSEEFIIVNEQFLVEFQIDNITDALEKSFVVENGKELRILGVVKDFNYVSIRDKIESFFFRYDPSQFAYANLKLNSTDITHTMTKLDASWNVISEDSKFEARFLDDELEDSLQSFSSMVKIFGFMGVLAVTISSLGLLAMVVFSAQNRVKEMGVRKVLGATVWSLTYSLSRSFLQLIAISVVISVPIAYFFFDKVFLRIHHYRANIGLAEIVAGVGIILLIAFTTIFTQALKTARSNPVDSLKYE